MKSPFKTPFVAVFQDEVLLNSKRVAPYALMILFIAHALLWWFKGPAIALGWATNSDFYIVRNLKGFSFLLGLPIFTAVMMGDPVIKDFRLGIDPLIFSKPISRGEYLLGKFFGSFFVLVCCQAAFTLTLLAAQAFPTSQMIVQPVRVLPYFKHFLFFVVITHLVLAAIYFTVGTLTRNSKIVYGLAVCFYPVYIAYGFLFLKGLPLRWRHVLDPFLLEAGSPSHNGFGHSADFLNQFVVRYSADMMANRAVMILIAAVCLAILYVRFAIAERPVSVEQLSLLNLSTAAEKGVYYDSDSFQETRGNQDDAPDYSDNETLRIVPLPEVTRVNEGFRANLNKLIAAIGIEFRLLRAERSLVVIMPLAIFLSTFELAFYEVAADVSYSAAYSSNTAKALLLFLIGITVFYTGEAIHRDREVKIEPLLWATPAANNVLLLSKFISTFLLTLFLVVLVGLTAILIQITRAHTPVEVSAYLNVYAVILIPSIALITASSTLLSVLLREKYLAYAVSIATGAGLFYLYSQGYNHWLYNPVLYGLWTYADLIGAESSRARILTHRVYCLAIASTCLTVAHLAFKRESSSQSLKGIPLRCSGWTLLVTVTSVTLAVLTGLMIVLR